MAEEKPIKEYHLKAIYGSRQEYDLSKVCRGLERLAQQEGLRIESDHSYWGALKPYAFREVLFKSEGGRLEYRSGGTWSIDFQEIKVYGEELEPFCKKLDKIVGDSTV